MNFIPSNGNVVTYIINVPSRNFGIKIDLSVAVERRPFNVRAASGLYRLVEFVLFLSLELVGHFAVIYNNKTKNDY